jgi:hypothetical protein
VKASLQSFASGCSESLGSFGASTFGFNLPIAWLSICDERIQQLTCRGSYFFYGAIERSLVRLRRLVEARELSDELKR